MELILDKQNPITVDTLRRDYIQSNAAITKGLVDVLHQMAEKGRPEYEAMLAKYIIGEVEWFLRDREKPERGGPGATLYAFNNPPQMKGESYKEWKLRTRDIVTVDDRLVLLLTNYDAVAPTENIHDAGTNFKVSLKKNHKALAAQKATEMAEQVVQQFIYKVQDKLLDLLLIKKTYTASLVKGGYLSGVFTADIQVNFGDGTKMLAHLILKTNYRNHRPYLQYPMTFHQVVTKPNAQPKALIASDDILRDFGVPVWTPPKDLLAPKRGWTKIEVGFVIQLKDGRRALVRDISVSKEQKLRVREANKIAKAAERAWYADIQNQTKRKTYNEAKEQAVLVKKQEGTAKVLLLDGTEIDVDINAIQRIVYKIYARPTGWRNRNTFNSTPCAFVEWAHETFEWLEAKPILIEKTLTGDDAEKTHQIHEIIFKRIGTSNE